MPDSPPQIKTVPLQPYRETAFCSCSAELEFTGEVLTTDPPQYVHMCPDLAEGSVWHDDEDGDGRYVLWEQYPRIEYREL